MWLRPLIGGFLLLGSCQPLPIATEIPPPAAAYAGWLLADSCTPPGPRVPLSELRLFIVADSTWMYGDTVVVGLHYRRQIYVAQWLQNDAWIWAHEIIHAWEYKPNGDVHPFVPFDTCRLRYWYHYPEIDSELPGLDSTYYRGRGTLFWGIL
jgi:hypothetical protein